MGEDLISGNAGSGGPAIRLLGLAGGDHGGDARGRAAQRSFFHVNK